MLSALMRWTQWLQDLLQRPCITCRSREPFQNQGKEPKKWAGSKAAVSYKAGAGVSGYALIRQAPLRAGPRGEDSAAAAQDLENVDPSQEQRPAKKRKKSKKVASNEAAEPSEAGAGKPWKRPQACKPHATHCCES